MGKKTGGQKRGRGDDKNASWSASDHDARKARQFRKNMDKQEQREQRSALLTRDSKEKHESGKIRLHTKRVQRQIEKLRERLQNWDDQEEAALKEKRQEDERKKLHKLEKTTKKGRKGPETWKLKGAARPAHEVYDFDTRYVCPHLKAHADYKAKVARSRNVLVIAKGRFGSLQDKDVPQPYCRDFLTLLMQLGNLSLQANQLKSARKAFLECLELDGIHNPVTPARCQLMRLYLEHNRPDSARKLWESLLKEDPSVWIRYSAALIEFVSWKLLEEPGSSQKTAELLLARAIKANVFCAYYLAFYTECFEQVMEHVEEIEASTEESPLEEAIEYCNSEQMGAWQGTEGASQWIQSFLKRILVSNEDVLFELEEVQLTKSNLDWRLQLSIAREQHTDATQMSNKVVEEEDEDDTNEGEQDANDEDDETVVDFAMFAGMFETALEMLEDEGSLAS
jgi:tetratricopeptide (TPR) repeat protein